MKAKDKPWFGIIHRLTAELHGGVTHIEAAEAATMLRIETGLDVDFIHNDRRYEVKTVITEKADKC